MKKKIKSIYLLLIAVVGVFSILGGCSGGGDDNEDLGPGPNGGPVLVDILGSAGDFVILAKTGISNTGTSAITGDIGVSPAFAASITGFALNLPAASPFATSALVTGKVYAPDYADPTPANMTTAIGDMETAYTTAAGLTAPAPVTELGAGNISGLTLEPGIYKWGTGVDIFTDLTLWGSDTATWVFQIDQGLTVANGVKVILAGGALPQNVYWVVAGGASLGTTVQFNGIILCMTAVTVNTGASVNGRLFAQTAVSLDANAVTQP